LSKEVARVIVVKVTEQPDGSPVEIGEPIEVPRARHDDTTMH